MKKREEEKHKIVVVNCIPFTMQNLIMVYDEDHNLIHNASVRTMDEVIPTVFALISLYDNLTEVTLMGGEGSTDYLQQYADKIANKYGDKIKITII